MIRVSVLYPRLDGKRFDLDYYKGQHMPLVKRMLSPQRVEVDTGITNHQEQPSPYVAVGHMTFASIEELVTRYGSSAEILHADIPNYTDIEPIIQLSEIVEI